MRVATKSRKVHSYPRRGLLRGRTVDTAAIRLCYEQASQFPVPEGGARGERERERDAKEEAEISARIRAIIAVEEAQSKGLAGLMKAPRCKYVRR